MSTNKMIFGIIVATVLTFSAVALVSKPDKKSADTTKKTDGFAVVELFTSEGCSSCPSADAAVAKLLNKNIDNVFILSYHVDYWDRLGWKDQFSKKEYSQRQSNYASKFNSESVYTPQVIVNGNTEFVGSDENKLTNSIQKSLQSSINNILSISAVKSNGSVHVNYVITSNDEQVLNIALVQPEATTNVKRGENNGRKLHHVNIVRDLKTIPGKNKGETDLAIPADLANQSLKIIAFTQNPGNWHVTGVVQSGL